ncbi:hypothetical protein SBDP1_1020012 [Syntrophobacter sp. SbD1]|nr:hypothetical protein SBDP1_1020012 [Syntrophobacter sp. SbD1]
MAIVAHSIHLLSFVSILLSARNLTSFILREDKLKMLREGYGIRTVLKHLALI